MTVAKKVPTKKSSANKAIAKNVSAKKAPAKRAPAKNVPAKKAPAKKRARNAAFIKAMTPSPALAAVVGDKPLPRTEVTKKVWEYIKRNNLQDQAKHTMIKADAKLRQIFGTDKDKGNDPGPSVTTFALMKAISRNLK